TASLSCNFRRMPDWLILGESFLVDLNGGRPILVCLSGCQVMVVHWVDEFRTESLGLVISCPCLRLNLHVDLSGSVENLVLSRLGEGDGSGVIHGGIWGECSSRIGVGR